MKKFAAFLLAAASLCTLNPASAKAEIESVVVRWDPLSCQESCIKQLDKEFRKIPGVVEVSVGAGEASLKYRKNSPFSFTPLKYALATIGLNSRNVRVRIRGTLHHTDKAVTLVSDGDNTSFTLINPVVPDMHGQSAQYNLDARQLQPALRQKLLDAEAEKQTATIEGPLYRPQRESELRLVVEQSSFTKPKADSKK